jgi:hypothetical protein
MASEAVPDATVPDGALSDGAVSDAPALLVDAGEDVADGSTGSTADSADDVAAEAQADSASGWWPPTR